jgi:GTP-binding protein
MQKLRNIAIIAHVDHGKTTLVDKMILHSKVFRDNQNPGELILDSNDLERERGITILSKNVSVEYEGVKINIIDTPGHSDFGGEVERVLNMADGVLLLADAFEGTMPQTRFVLQKAIELGLKPIVVVNKVAKPNCRPEEVQEQVFDLMFSLDATEEQLDFPTIYGSSKEGWMSKDWKIKTDNITTLFDAIIKHIPAPIENKGTPQMLITSLDYSNYVGRIAIGRVNRGELKEGMTVSLAKRDGSIKRTRIKELHTFKGLGREKVESVTNGDICALVGIDGFEIGDSICDIEKPEPLVPIAVDEPTMSMLFTINDSPFFGKEGKFVTSRHIHDRLEKELEKNLALRIEPTEGSDAWNVHGRGVLHLSVLIETMRREGYELQVGQPQEMMNMERKGDRVHLEFHVPSRGIIGLRTNMLTATQGEAVMSHRFLRYEPFKGEIPSRQNGSLIALETGTSFAYALNKLQDRGKFFISPQEDIYAGQVLGENTRAGDLTINVTKAKKQSNVRSSGADEKVKLAPPIIFSLEEALEYIQKDEYVEVTPESIRLRKILLNEHDRKRASK